MVAVARTWHEGVVLLLLACIFLFAAYNLELGDDLVALFQTRSDFGEGAVRRADGDGVGFEDLAFLPPDLLLRFDGFDALVVGEHGLGGLETQGFGRHGEDIVFLGGEDGHVGCQTGFEFEVVIACRDDDFVGHDVALRRGLLAHLGDVAVEDVVGEGIDGERDALPFLHAADVSLVDIGNDAHVGEVLCDDEEGWRVHGRGYGLSFLHLLGQHDAVDGRCDGGITEVGLGLLHVLLLTTICWRACS